MSLLDDINSVPFLEPNLLQFSVFTSEQVEQLSVKKISRPVTFDLLGHPLADGLYDKHLGPHCTQSEPCGTCMGNFTTCPGHFGYFDLPLPVVNPMFSSVIFKILKITCGSCYNFRLSANQKSCISMQMKLLEVGLITEALELEEAIKCLKPQSQEEDNLIEDLDVLLKECKKKIKKAKKSDVFFNLNVQDVKLKILHEMTKNVKEKCSCNSKLKIKVLHKKIFAPIKNTDNDHTGIFRIITAEEIKQLMRNVWENNASLLKQLMPMFNRADIEYPTDILFLKNILLTPATARPVNFVNGQVIEHEQTQLYKEILNSAILLRQFMILQKSNDDFEAVCEATRDMYKLTQGASTIEKIHNVWEGLQFKVNCLLDKERSKRQPGLGLKQHIEKKEGLIRMHMMGKRVNFSARSVITPDPFLSIDEVGIPEVIAKELTYPQAVNHLNIEEIRKCVMNGPLVHPGAVKVDFGNGIITRLSATDALQRKSVADRLLTPDERGKTHIKKVHRHLMSGDSVLLNRQPSLHKPSIMSHRVRVLKGEKTLRLHYANCKHYNADFDGDEMNVHFPQNEIARSEAANLALACYVYASPKDGSPLSSLIQDHIVASVHMTMRGKFFTKYEYHQFVTQAFPYKLGGMELLKPAIIKPLELWSGKQVVSTVIINVLPQDKKKLNLTSKSKINADTWKKDKNNKYLLGDMTESDVIIKDGALLVGILDKNQYGMYGLIHCVYELYGGKYAGKLLSAFSKLFTYFLQWQGFTLSIKDILVSNTANVKRTKIIKDLRVTGPSIMKSALNINVPQISAEDIVKKLGEAKSRNPKMRTIIDSHYKQALDEYTNKINKTCLPTGLISPFPDNNLQMMVQSGAKGSTVNTMQISCLLGQIELEGKRPPLVISGKPIPCFPSSEFCPRAGGYIDGRFMTGIQPEDFFFHCMAGREGLIDTAVKTSRSGYLQRCLVKSLEGLKVDYDLTVRDTDGSIIQHLYGEDGLNVTQAKFFNNKNIKLLMENMDVILDKERVAMLKDGKEEQVKAHIKKIKHWKKKYNTMEAKSETPFKLFSAIVEGKSDLEDAKILKEGTGRSKLAMKTVKLWYSASEEIKTSLDERCQMCPDPVNSVFRPDLYFGSLSNKLIDLMETSDCAHLENFKDMFKLKAMESLCQPGEPVGLLAAQSLGEPSTQMTLNTFHFAGRGDMNVTLGIPRIREILMEASKTPKTPAMEIPFLDLENIEQIADDLKRKLTKVCVSDVLVDFEWNSKIIAEYESEYWQHEIKCNFLPHDLYKSLYVVKPKDIIKHIETKFLKLIYKTLKTTSKITTHTIGIINNNVNTKTAENSDDSSDELESDADEYEEDGKQIFKLKTENEDDENEDYESDEENDETNSAEPSNQQTVTENDEDISRFKPKLDNCFEYDLKKYEWCTFSLKVPVSINTNLPEMLKILAKKSIIHEVTGINKAITYKSTDNNKLVLRTDGCNITEMFKYSHILDLRNLYSNDIHKMAEIYGIDAAQRVIEKEIREVFAAYSITVDPRHLSLVAAKMVYSGTYTALNRQGMALCVSPLLQMSFETSTKFLQNAIVTGKNDNIDSLSSQIMVGKPIKIGTGTFDIYHDYSKQGFNSS